ncbi:MAG TPA: glycosyltransferase family 87 protein [Polyangiales bacterium]|nr:glycosyltransferase family 87 protein [Polyangiales bacterium]
MLLRPGRWLVVALALAALINVGFMVVAMAHGDTLEEAHSAPGLLLSGRLLDPNGVDSWRTMAAAWLSWKINGDMYVVFLKQHIKFQYPPSSLLLMPLIQLPLDGAFRARMTYPACIAVVLTVLCGILLGLRLLWPRDRPMDFRDPTLWCCALLIGTLGWLYLPLTMGHSLGQIQVYIGALAAFGLVANAWDRPLLSGACLGLCCLLKPQLAIVLIWALLRRQWRMCIGFSAVVAVGLSISLWKFGLHSHLQYLEVLQQLGRTGESYGPNQSVNGVVNRWLENGPAMKFQSRGFPPYNPIVYYSTLISSALLIGLALFAPVAKEVRGRPLDLALMICAATLASPIAWEHHYGMFFPVFAIALPAAMAMGRSGVLLLVSYELVANMMIRPKIMFASRWVSLLGSHMFFGGLLLFGLLLWARARGATAVAPAEARRSQLQGATEAPSLRVSGQSANPDLHAPRVCAE